MRRIRKNLYFKDIPYVKFYQMHMIPLLIVAWEEAR